MTEYTWLQDSFDKALQKMADKYLEEAKQMRPKVSKPGKLTVDVSLLDIPQWEDNGKYKDQ